MISVVNGYVCTCSCDAAKAKKGENPHTQPGQLPGDPSSKTDKTKNGVFDPAVILDGALKASSPANASTASASSSPATPQPSIDISV